MPDNFTFEFIPSGEVADTHTWGDDGCRLEICITCVQQRVLTCLSRQSPAVIAFQKMERPEGRYEHPYMVWYIISANAEALLMLRSLVFSQPTCLSRADMQGRGKAVCREGGFAILLNCTKVPRAPLSIMSSTGRWQISRDDAVHITQDNVHHSR